MLLITVNSAYNGSAYKEQPVGYKELIVIPQSLTFFILCKNMDIADLVTGNYRLDRTDFSVLKYLQINANFVHFWSCSHLDCPINVENRVNVVSMLQNFIV